MSWEDISVRKPGPAPDLGLGRMARPDVKGRDRSKMPVATNARRAQHARCIEHVEVAGLRQPVCITRGADREALIAEARELAGAE